jgi:hypothetical protein
MAGKKIGIKRPHLMTLLYVRRKGQCVLLVLSKKSTRAQRPNKLGPAFRDIEVMRRWVANAVGHRDFQFKQVPFKRAMVSEMADWEKKRWL